MPNLPKGLHDEIIRNKELVKIYQSIGRPGEFAATTILKEIEEAEAALESGDIIQMIQSCKQLQENKE